MAWKPKAPVTQYMDYDDGGLNFYSVINAVKTLMLRIFAGVGTPGNEYTTIHSTGPMSLSSDVQVGIVGWDPVNQQPTDSYIALIRESDATQTALIQAYTVNIWCQIMTINLSGGATCTFNASNNSVSFDGLNSFTVNGKEMVS